eukprot:1746186-Prymnesium_polylepis.2
MPAHYAVGHGAHLSSCTVTALERRIPLQGALAPSVTLHDQSQCADQQCSHCKDEQFVGQSKDLL